MINRKFIIILISLFFVLALLITSLYVLSLQRSTSTQERTAQLIAEKEVIFLEISDTPENLAYGLMNRDSMDINQGMIFVFQEELPRTFWMKDTYISLDIIFLDSEFNVLKIYSNTKINQTSETYPSSFPTKFVIELSSGSANRLKIQEGDKLAVKF